MKKRLFLLAIIALALATSYWAAEHGQRRTDHMNSAGYEVTPDPGYLDRRTLSDSPDMAAFSGHKFREGDGFSPTLSRSQGQPSDDDDQVQPEAHAFSLMDPFKREQLADNMRQRPSSEEEIETSPRSSLADLFSGEEGRSFTMESPATEGEDGAAATYNLNDDSEREQYADLMRQGGASEQEIEAFLGDSPQQELAAGEGQPFRSEPPATEGEGGGGGMGTYNLQ